VPFGARLFCRSCCPCRLFRSELLLAKRLSDAGAERACCAPGRRPCSVPRVCSRRRFQFLGRTHKIAKRVGYRFHSVLRARLSRGPSLCQHSAIGRSCFLPHCLSSPMPERMFAFKRATHHRRVSEFGVGMLVGHPCAATEPRLRAAVVRAQSTWALSCPALSLWERRPLLPGSHYGRASLAGLDIRWSLGRPTELRSTLYIDFRQCVMDVLISWDYFRAGDGFGRPVRVSSNARVFAPATMEGTV
jgi:hypothetical protein